MHPQQAVFRSYNAYRILQLGSFFKHQDGRTPSQSSSNHVISRILERIVARDIYPSLSLPPPCMSFGDQFAFQPTASTTAALIYLCHTVITLLDTNPFIIVCALDFSKALI